MNKFQELSTLYKQTFGEVPPVHDLGMWPSPAQATAMVERALERGTPIQPEDFPEVPDQIVV